MHILATEWNVKIEYEKAVDGRNGPVTRQEMRRAQIHLADGKLRIQTWEGEGHCMLLARAELIEITPTKMVFEAYWWSAKIGGDKFDKMVKAKVVAEF